MRRKSGLGNGWMHLRGSTLIKHDSENVLALPLTRVPNSNNNSVQGPNGSNTNNWKTNNGPCPSGCSAADRPLTRTTTLRKHIKTLYFKFPSITLRLEICELKVLERFREGNKQSGNILFTKDVLDYVYNNPTPLKIYEILCFYFSF